MSISAAHLRLACLFSFAAAVAIGVFSWGGSSSLAADAKKTDLYGDPLPAGAVARLGTLRLRHSGPARGVALAPDGKAVASGGSDGRAVIWDVASGTPLAQFVSEQVYAVAYSPDGRTLAAAAGDVILYDVQTKSRRLLKAKGSRAGTVLAVTFSPDGKRLASAGTDGFVRLWDVERGEEIRSWAYPGENQLRAIAFSPDGTLLACGSGIQPGANKDAPVRLLNMITGGVVRTFYGLSERVQSLAFSPDGKTLAAASGPAIERDDEMVRLWDISSGDFIWIKRGHHGVLAFSPDGKTLVEGHGRILRYLRASDGHVLREIEAHWENILAISFSRDGKTLATASSDNTVKLWNAADGKEVTPVCAAGGAVESLAFSPDGKIIAASNSDSAVRLWDVASPKQLMCHTDYDILEGGQSAGSEPAAFSPDGLFVASVVPRKVRVWRTADGKVTKTLPIDDLFRGPGLKTYNLSLLGAAGPRDAGPFWSTGDWERIPSLELPEKQRYVNATAPPGRRIIAAAGVGGRLYWCDGRTGHVLSETADSELRVHSLAFSPDGKMLATVSGREQFDAKRRSKDPVVALWDVPTGQFIRRFRGHEQSVYGVDFSPDGLTIATAGAEDRTIRLWSALTGQALAKREGHAANVYCVAFSPDGKTVASGSADGTVLLWDARGLAAAPAAQILGPEQLQALWSDLVHNDVPRAYGALATMVAGENASVKFLDARVKPMREPDAKRIEQLIAALDTEEFEAREKAQQELGDYEGAVESALGKALEGSPTPEKKRRLQALLARIREPRPTGERLRAIRAVQVLEYIGSPAAVEVLESLAKGAAGAGLTRDAKEAAERAKRRGGR
jgi:WD40 repeat protein